jgi:hypothetical protein
MTGKMKQIELKLQRESLKILAAKVSSQTKKVGNRERKQLLLTNLKFEEKRGSTYVND